MSAVLEQAALAPAERLWSQLAVLEDLHQGIRRSHERVLRTLDQAVIGADPGEIRSAWNEYRSVVAELSRITADIESLRLHVG